MSRPILNFHAVSDDAFSPAGLWTVSPELFEQQLDLLESKGLRGVTVSESLDNPSPEQVVLTFDDGYEDFASRVGPALAARGFRATVFVVTGEVGSRNSAVGDGSSHMASWDQLRELDRDGFEVGSHSHTHPQLDLLDPVAALGEVQQSKSIIEAQLGHRVRGFCYPHGFYTRRVQRYVEEAGFDYACGVKHKMSSLSDDRFSLARIVVERNTDPERLGRWLDGQGLRPGGMATERTLAAGFRAVRRAKRRPALRS